MLLPDDNGQLHCEDDCDFSTTDVYELLDHCNIEFEWSIKISKEYSFNLFPFLEKLSHLLDAGDLEYAYDLVQDASILMCNAGAGELDEFIDECLIKEGLDETLKGLERMLKENG